MRLRILLSLAVLVTLSTTASAAIINVPSRTYPTIQSGINAAFDGDEVVVAQGTYSGPDNTDLDFGGKAITVRSRIDPNNPDPSIIAATIIDCQGDRYNPTRAFYFHNGEDANSKVLGFTIINGYARGDAGTQGSGHSTIPIVPEDYNTPPIAGFGGNANGDGYGGAILCEGSSPTIGFCVISDCTVTGAQGGDGADGVDGLWTYVPLEVYGSLNNPSSEPEEVSQGQWGGTGGTGLGNGYGGAIACNSGSSPVIFGCTMKNNIARGGCGGNGGAGGEGEKDQQDEYMANGGVGGEGGNAIGDGRGGAIYCDVSSKPVVTNCSFSNNVATEGLAGLGGQRGQGSEEDPVPVDGNDGDTETLSIAGGAAYYKKSDANFTGCVFTDNQAYETYLDWQGNVYYIYTNGGALYSKTNSNVYLNNCQFNGNLGGAVYLESNNTLEIESSSFQSNTEVLSGGAVYIDTGCTVDINNSSFSGNSAYYDGGAIESKSNITIRNSSFGSNRAYGYGGQFSGYGGAVDVFLSGSTLTAHIENSSFVGNQAVTGGGFSSEAFDANFVGCYFISNSADSGGGLDLAYGDVNIVGGLISTNHAAENDGGGLNLVSSSGQVRDCVLKDNLADAAGAAGGGISFNGDDGPLSVFNCLLTGNSAAAFGGAINSYWAAPDVNHCTFSDNTAGVYGGAVFADQGSATVKLTNSIFDNCNNHSIYENSTGDALVEFCLFYSNPDGDFYDSATALTYAGPDIPGGSNNLYGAPVFVSGPLGDFYLSQLHSPAIDSGSIPASAAGLDSYTTDAAGALDTGQVDRGYHYSDIITGALPDYSLTVYVQQGQGTIEILTPPDPAVDPNYFIGAVVTVRATPTAGWFIDGWSGTTDDSSKETTNTVVMISDKTVGVRFRQPRTLLVSVGGGEPGFYADIPDALNDAEDGDTIIVYPGIYYNNDIVISKAVTIRSLNPEYPACVAETIIDRTGYPACGFNIISSGVVLNGLTIQNVDVSGGTPQEDGKRDEGGSDNHPDGYDGGTIGGGGLRIYENISTVIKNCIIKDNRIHGGHGTDGVGADDENNAGRGGWGGWGRGGGAYCGRNSNVEFINCQIVDNIARGGNGGNGGNYTQEGGTGNYGGNWSRAEWYYINSNNLETPFILDDLWQEWGYEGDYRKYSGYGGGVYCDVGSTVTFTNCTIKDNLAQGGMSGLGGTFAGGTNDRHMPVHPYELPSFGGGVYCDADTVVTFTGCTITDNISSDPSFDHTIDARGLIQDYDPLNTYHLDPYLGHGGGVCAENSATVVFNDCVFSENQAAAGGGLHFANANPQITDCEFTDNTAYHGAGMLGEHGPAMIIGCQFTGNIAMTDTNLPDINDPNVVIEEVLGTGAGLHFWATDAEIMDCDISENQADYSAGGVFFGGEGQPVLNNCLIERNRTGNYGGGLANQTFSQLTISNCTVSKNVVTESDPNENYGGGLYCSDSSAVDIINSIFWGNSGDSGPQLAVATAPAEVNVSYSDVQGGAVGVFVDVNCTLDWDYATNLTGTSASNPAFVNGYYLSQPATGDANQTSLSPCVDAGLGDVNSLALGYNRYTTRTDDYYDTNEIDLGYHYYKEGYFVDGDINYDGSIDFDDVILLMSYWLYECNYPDWCSGADVDHSGRVNFKDFAAITVYWGAGDLEPPAPDPMTWAVAPRSAGDSSVTMTATTAVDESGANVEYEFECVYGGGSSRDWGPNSTYTDTGLAVGTEYGYRVRARDMSVNRNQTGWSFVGYAITGEDSTPPNPDPMTWATQPYATLTDTVSMTASTATDPEGYGVKYYFDCYSHPQFSGDWQDSTVYEVSGLDANTEYTFRVKARDESQNQNETDWSGLASVLISDGNEPNEPNGVPQTPTPDPSQWDPVEDANGFTGHPRQTVDGPGPFDYGFTMRAQEPNQTIEGGVEYFFECTSNGSFSSGWQESSTYSRSSVGGEYLNFIFRVKARNQQYPELETAWSPEDSTRY